MSFSDETRSRIYDRTGGNCHLCGKKLSFQHYGIVGARGAWEVEHSIPQSLGGTDHLNNLYAACIACDSREGDKLDKNGSGLEWPLPRAAVSRAQKRHPDRQPLEPGHNRFVVWCAVRTRVWHSRRTDRRLDQSEVIPPPPTGGIFILDIWDLICLQPGLALVAIVDVDPRKGPNLSICCVRFFEMRNISWESY